MLKVIMTRGLPASGKSTWAKEFVSKDPFNWKRVNRDSIRHMMDNYAHLKEDEKMLEKIRDSLILTFLNAGKNVVVDDMNLSARHEGHLSQLVKGKAGLDIKEFMDVPVGELLRRNAARPEADRVPNRVIKTLAKQFYKRPAPPEYDPNLPYCIIVDIDGTLALLGDRNPYDAADSAGDLVNKPIYEVVRRFYAPDNNLSIEKVFIVTGRDEKYRSITKDWLDRKSIPYHSLFMRDMGDRRKDFVAKKEIYEEHIKGKYNVLFVLEDRNQVVEMYRRELKLPVLQVADGDY